MQDEKAIIRHIFLYFYSADFILKLRRDDIAFHKMLSRGTCTCKDANISFLHIYIRGFGIDLFIQIQSQFWEEFCDSQLP